MASFVAVVDGGSFAAAAMTLGVSAQIVGRRIAQLEARLGAPLIVRNTRKSRLTEAGRSYYEQCRAILDAVDAAERSILATAQGPPRGALTISAPQAFGSVLLPPIIAEFLRAFPFVSVRLMLESGYTDLIEKHVDAAIRVGALPDSEMRVRSLGEYRLAPFATPDYLALHGDPAVCADLIDHECIIFAYGDGRFLDEWEFVSGEVHEKVHVSGRFITQDGRAMTELALVGHGIVFQEERVIASLSAGRLTRLLPTYQVPAKPLNIVYSPATAKSPALQAFIDMITVAFARFESDA